MNWLELQQPMTRRRALLLGVGAAVGAVLAACGSTSSSGDATSGTGDGGGESSEPANGGATGTTIRMVDGNAFDPEQLTVRVGDSVTWENTASSIHTVTCDPENPMGVEHVLPDGAETFNSGNVAPGDSFSHTFEVAGDYTYSCMLHLPMVGRVTVQA